MNLPTVFETCEPRKDVLTGTIAEADFAAHLAKVIRGTASDDYQIPFRFPFRAVVEEWPAHRPTVIRNQWVTLPTTSAPNSLTSAWPQLSRLSSSLRTVRSSVTFTTTSAAPSVSGIPVSAPVFSSRRNHAGPRTSKKRGVSTSQKRDSLSWPNW